MSIETANPLRAMLAADGFLLDAATGDRAAFGRLYAATASPIYGRIRRILIEVSQSEEVTQEVFLEVWQRAARYDPAVGSAISWMLAIAHNRAIDRARASQASRTRDLKIGVRDFPGEFDQVAERGEVTIEYERARRALHRLTPIQREAVTLTYRDGLTVHELAEMLQVNVGTAKTRRRDGLIRLRLAMESD